MSTVTATEIVDGLTRDQCRRVLKRIIEVITENDNAPDLRRFVGGMREASEMAERLALEVSA